MCEIFAPLFYFLRINSFCLIWLVILHQSSIFWPLLSFLAFWTYSLQLPHLSLVFRNCPVGHLSHRNILCTEKSSLFPHPMPPPSLPCFIGPSEVLASVVPQWACHPASRSFHETARYCCTAAPRGQSHLLYSVLTLLTPCLSGALTTLICFWNICDIIGMCLIG